MSNPAADLPPSVMATIESLLDEWRIELRRLYPLRDQHWIDNQVRIRRSDWALSLSRFTWSVDAIHSALARSDPGLAANMIVVATDYEPYIGGALVLVWTTEDQERVAAALRSAAPGMQVSIYSTMLEAMNLGISSDRWYPLWVEAALRDHSIDVNQESEYVGKAVERASKHHWNLKTDKTNWLQELRVCAATPEGALVAYSALYLAVAQWAELVAQYEARPANTVFSTTETAAWQAAVISRDLLILAIVAIESNWGRIQSTEAFAAYVAHAIDALSRALPVYGAILARNQQGENQLGPLISTAGVVRTELATRRPASVGEASNGDAGISPRRRGWRLDNALYDLAGSDSTDRERIFAELIASSLPDVLEAWQLSATTPLDENVKKLRNAVARRIEGEALEQGKRTTNLQVVRLAHEPSATWEGEDFEGGEGISGDVPALERWQAGESLELRADLDRFLPTLTPPQRTALYLASVEGYSMEEIAEHLRVAVGTAKSHLFRARQKAQDFLRHYRAG